MGATEYLKELRAAVGTRPLVVAGACVIVHDNLGRVLLQRRTDDGNWGVAFHTQDVHGQPQPDRDEVDEVGFFAADALPIPLNAGARLLLEKLHRGEAGA